MTMMDSVNVQKQARLARRHPRGQAMVEYSIINWLLLAALLVLIVRPVRLVGAFALLAPTATVRSWVRATGPPPAWQFSVIRC